ncbi:hypothetical protein AUR64_09325 [Haloprofundus marisrubri]|uniref:DUF304 domain-containing protein n=1 Tax=Haloprofundus marisrubri TaxID=1514971 RepID=A0A0W1R8P7_9EURY|nr:DUF6498-containing protein [Haloprofundus marisrubri]KTG09820.1 hypothetical protein AUR64_09325 [Haloprofundus marisrubri]
MRPDPVDSDGSTSRALLVVANLIPAVGVLAFDWSVGLLLTLYWFEVGVTMFFAGPKALFAEGTISQQLADSSFPFEDLFEKRGGVRVDSRLPPVYPRNVPVAVVCVAVWLPLWLVTGVVFFGVLDIGAPLTLTTGVSMLLGAVGLFVTRASEFRDDYLHGERYRQITALVATGVPTRQLIAVWLLGIVFVGAVDAGTVGFDAGATAVALLAVALKTGYELYSYRYDHADREPNRVAAMVFGTPDVDVDRSPIHVPDSEPTRRLTPSRRSVRVGGSLLGLVDVVTLFVLLLWVLLRNAIGPIRATVVLGSVLLALVTVQMGAHYLRYGTMRYDCYATGVVAHDRWLDAPQQWLPYDRVDKVIVSKGVTGRLLGTGTVRLHVNRNWTYDTNQIIELAHLDAPERVAEELEQRVHGRTGLD